VLSVLVGLLLGARSAAAQAVDAPPAGDKEGDFAAWLAAQRDTAGRPCSKLATETLADRIVVACGSAGVWVVRRDGQRGYALVRTEDMGAPVVGFFVRGGSVWAEILHTETRTIELGAAPNTRSFPMESAPGAAPAAPVAPGAVPAKVEGKPVQREGRVVERRAGEVVVDLGRRDGLRSGESVELSVLTTERMGDEDAVVRDVLAVGEVNAVSERYSSVMLGIDERVPVGALARRTTNQEPSASRTSPPRLGGLWEAGFMIRPFVAIDNFGGGVLVNASIGYRFEGDFHLKAALEPFAYANGRDKPGTVPFAAFVQASYDLPLFEAGFGVGAATVNDVDFGTDAGTGTLFVQSVRFGAIDGLELDLATHVVLFHSQFRFANFMGSGQAPVGRKSWLVLRGGGGLSGFGYGEFGVRMLLRGNGDRGSLFFTGTLGGAVVFVSRSTVCSSGDFAYDCGQTTTYAGPLLGAGAEWRF
jgi:hypothetical protein